MGTLIRFMLNDTLVETSSPGNGPALDFIRNEMGLKGTKEGCREGDCGACMILLGTSAGYVATPSCLLGLGDVDGKHLVTIEGIAVNGLTPVMNALLAENGSQCGFCSPGFVISLTNFLLSEPVLDPLKAVIALEGNLCRCTGYGSILRAANRLVAEFKGLPRDFPARAEALVRAGVIPKSIPAFMKNPLSIQPSDDRVAGNIRIGGGTDFFVRNPEPSPGRDMEFLDHDPSLRNIAESDGTLSIGSAVTVRDFFADKSVRGWIPGIERFEETVASLPIRTRATLGGNVVNASPVGDMTAMLIALDASAELSGPSGTRMVKLADFFLSYKKTALDEDEIVSRFIVPSIDHASKFNFEKVSKRSHLDIASVNSGALITVKDGIIAKATISAGGVAAIPMMLSKTNAYLRGKPLAAATVIEAAAIASSEITPMGDVRGSAEYRKRLMDRLVRAHFARAFPEALMEKELFP